MATDTGAAGGKAKGKKNKGTKLDINDIVDQNSFKMVESWADEMENEEIRVPIVQLPTAPKATTGADIDMDQVPHHPPFKVYVFNISFESSPGQLEKFFSHLPNAKVSMGGGREGERPAGNAHVEFESRADLIEALKMNGKTMGTRQLKIQLPMDRMGGGFGSRDGGGRRNFPDNTPSNWRNRDALPPKTSANAPPPTAPEFEGRSGGGFGSGFRNNNNNFGGFRDRNNDEGGYRGGRDFNRGDRDSFRSNRDAPSFNREDREFRAPPPARDAPPSNRDVDGPRENFGRDREDGFGAGGGGGRREYGAGRDDFRPRGDREGGFRQNRYGDEGGAWQHRPRNDAPSESGSTAGDTESNWRTAPRPERPVRQVAPPAAHREDRGPRDGQRNDYRSGDHHRNDRRDHHGGGGGRFGDRNGDRNGGFQHRERRNDDYNHRGGDRGEGREGGYQRRDNNNRNHYQNDHSNRRQHDQSQQQPHHSYDRQNSGGSASASEDQQQQQQQPPSQHRQERTINYQSTDSKPKIDMKVMLQAITQVGAEDDAGKPNSYSSIFGGAKPVDNAHKDMEIERKLAEDRQKKEAELEAAKKAAAEKNAAKAAEGKAAAEAAAANAAGPRPEVLLDKSDNKDWTPVKSGKKSNHIR